MEKRSGGLRSCGAACISVSRRATQKSPLLRPSWGTAPKRRRAGDLGRHLLLSGYTQEIKIGDRDVHIDLAGRAYTLRWSPRELLFGRSLGQRKQLAGYMFQLATVALSHALRNRLSKRRCTRTKKYEQQVLRSTSFLPKQSNHCTCGEGQTFRRAVDRQPRLIGPLVKLTVVGHTVQLADYGQDRS